MNQRYLCIHGHFYQPPRENPGLDEVEVQDSAYPFHDWNERVSAECYAPNAAARVLDSDGKILDILNNYEKISFDFGPTLLSWMERHEEATYQKILEADRVSVQVHHGHGNAMAQIFNHIIMPLASSRDKETQIIWGIRDFEYRFGRKPEGMWLSETAVDLETLEILAQHEIRFTVLSPYQASKIRSLASQSEWTDVTGGKIDPSKSYRLRLKNDRWIDLFFYDGPVSFQLAFGDALSNGEMFIQKIMGGFSPARHGAQILALATDGESYGHHRKFGEMALSYALHKIEAQGEIQLTNFGEFLELHPPEWEVQIYENTSWSCAHGVGRWKEDCGCRMDHYLGWNQRWRKPLREGLDALKEKLDVKFETETKSLLLDPWKARNDYVEVMLHRSCETVEKFLQTHAPSVVGDEEKAKVLKLLEIQRNGLLMFTSCGWFFDEISGLEPVQILNYADRAVQIAQSLREDFEPLLISFLAKAKSNFKDWGTGQGVYEKAVKPGRVDFKRALAHWAISGLFESYPQQGALYAYAYRSLGVDHFLKDAASFSTGRVIVSSSITFESQEMAFALLHLGGPDFHCVTWHNHQLGEFETVKTSWTRQFQEGLSKEIIGEMKRNSYWTLKDLFLDEKRKVLGWVTEANLLRLEESLKDFYDQNQMVMEHLWDEGIPLPKGFHLAVEYVLARDLDRIVKMFSGEEKVLKKVQEILEKAKHWEVSLDLAPLQKALESGLETSFLQKDFKAIERVLTFSNESAPGVSLWKIQNLTFDFLKKEGAKTSLKDLESLGKRLGFHSKFFKSITSNA